MTSREWIPLLVLSLITTFTWIGYEIYRAATTITTTEVLERQMNPVNPELDQTTIEMLRSATE